MLTDWRNPAVIDWQQHNAARRLLRETFEDICAIHRKAFPPREWLEESPDARARKMRLVREYAPANSIPEGAEFLNEVPAESIVAAAHAIRDFFLGSRTREGVRQ